MLCLANLADCWQRISLQAMHSIFRPPRISNREGHTSLAATISTRLAALAEALAQQQLVGEHVSRGGRQAWVVP